MQVAVVDAGQQEAQPALPFSFLIHYSISIARELTVLIHFHYWLKSIAKTVLIRKKLMSDNVFLIYQNEDILYSGYSIFDSGTELGPHKDPKVHPVCTSVDC